MNIDESNYIDVAAIILSVSDVERGKLDEIDATGYDIPVLLQRKMKNVYQQNIFHVFLVSSNMEKHAKNFMVVS